MTNNATAAGRARRSALMRAADAGLKLRPGEERHRIEGSNVTVVLTGDFRVRSVVLVVRDGDAAEVVIADSRRVCDCGADKKIEQPACGRCRRRAAKEKST